MLIKLLNLLVLTFVFPDFGECAETTCQDSQRHFADLCFSPKTFTDIDWKWAQAAQPSNGWYFVLGNDVSRLHLSEMLKGQLLSPSDNFDDLCIKNKISIADDNKKTFDGQYFGFGNLMSNWTCKYSADSPGVFQCEDLSQSTNYRENFNYYPAYTNNKSIVLIIACFPNGEVGWHIASLSNDLTDDEKKFIDDKLTSLGFSTRNIVTLYDKYKCPNEN